MQRQGCPGGPILLTQPPVQPSAAGHGGLVSRACRGQVWRALQSLCTGQLHQDKAGPEGAGPQGSEQSGCGQSGWMHGSTSSGRLRGGATEQKAMSEQVPELFTETLLSGPGLGIFSSRNLPQPKHCLPLAEENNLHKNGTGFLSPQGLRVINPLLYPS